MIRLSVVLSLLFACVSSNSFAGGGFYELFTTPLYEGEVPLTRFAKATAYLHVKQTKLKEQNDRCKKLVENFPPSLPGSSAQQAILELNSLRSMYLGRSGHLTCLQENFAQGRITNEILRPTFGAALAGQSQNDPLSMAQGKLNAHKQAASFFEALVFEHLVTTGNQDLITVGRLALKYEQDKVDSWSARLQDAFVTKLLTLNMLAAQVNKELKQKSEEALAAAEKAKRELAEAYKQNQSLKEANGQLLLNLQLSQAQSAYDMRLTQNQSAQQIARLTKERDEALDRVKGLGGTIECLTGVNNLLNDDDDNPSDSNTN